MADDKVNASEENPEHLEIGVLTDPVPMIVCPGCGVEIDTEDIASFTEIACPECKTRQTVPAKLGGFRLLSVIGSGGMGAVFLAQDDTLNRRVAIKVMLGSIGSDPEILATFRREAQSAARLNNPHIVQIYSFGEEKGQPYLVMELVSGGALDDLMELGEPLDPAFVIRVGVEIAEGLATAQAANLLHGDIKPENILFDERRQAKLVDFGIASMLGSKDAASEVWGTPFYIAPEKALRKKPDVRSDIFSLGATLYHAVAGKPPFDGEDEVAVIKARFDGPAQPLAEIRPGIDPQAAAIIERMMQSDLFLRYPNYTSLMKDMRKYLETVPDNRKVGPMTRKLRMRKSTDASGANSGDLVNGSGGLRSSGGQSGALRAAGGSPAPSSNSGRKAFVIQKGAVAASALYPPVAPLASLATSDSSDTAASARIPGGEQGGKPRRGMSPKAFAVLILSLFGIGILAAVVTVIAILAGGSRKEKALDAKYVQAQGFETERAALTPAIQEAVASVEKRDADARKILASTSELIQKTLSMPWRITDLEPPEVVAPDVPESTLDAPETDDAPAPPPPEDPAAAAAEDGAESPPPEDEPDAEAFAEAKPPLVLKADRLLDPARQIRARLREAEALRDRREPNLGAIKREAMTDEVWTSRKERFERRRQDLERIHALAKECDALLLAMRRMVPELEKEASVQLTRLRRQEEAERQARLKEEAEAARLREQEARDARVRAEVEYVESLIRQRQEQIRRYDYGRVSEDLKRARPDVITEGGIRAMEGAIERYARLQSLRDFIVADLREHQGLRWGFGVVDIIGADEEGIIAMGGRKVAFADITIAQWITMIDRLLTARPPERSIRLIEYGEQLFNAAIFCDVHGGGSETARTKALTLLRMALQRRTALRPDVPRLLPSFAGENLDSGGN